MLDNIYTAAQALQCFSRRNSSCYFKQWSVLWTLSLHYHIVHISKYLYIIHTVNTYQYI